ncbi:TPA: hypothetical protein ACRRGJ_005472 [Klebsiella pneumoniae]|uniref:hypothetical protein n=1 Tax=Enterobacteriaceae TaxID=543 RepID=UPI001E5BEFF1|nr:hypothetical protein [Leclercia sp. G3L]UGB00630.1 hypothetical protein LRS40_01415 [Leclercia sp. G3L]UGB00637.1 hypothetical protein LRS40_01375 [Leclercia sp. G3L]
MTSTPTLPTFAAPTDTERATLAAILNDTGLRATTPRINILHLLNITDVPLPAGAVSHCIDLPLSTAYRTLTTLEINRLAGVTFGRGDITRWFRFTPDRPQHCPACGQSFYGEYS